MRPGTPTPTAAPVPAGTGLTDCLSEWLPTAAYADPALHFRLTARDRAAAGGGTAYDDVTLTLDKTAGPLEVTSQATAATLPGGSQQTVTWNVRQTNKPTLAPTVNIRLSRDGGQTWGAPLAGAVPNDGTQLVTLPDANVSDARLKVEAVGNYFYDVNDASFAIHATGAPAPLVVDRSGVPAPLAAQFSDPVTAGFSASSGQGSAALAATATGLPAGLSVSAKTVAPPSAASWTVTGTTTAPPGSYLATFSVTDGDATRSFSSTFVVSAEDASVTYTGPTYVEAASLDSNEVSVTLSAQVAQAGDGHPGAINAATVRFINESGGVTLCEATIAAAGAGPVSASCSFTVDLSVEEVVSFLVKPTVGGFYRGTTFSTGLTVTLPEEELGAPDTAITSGPTGWLLATTAVFGFSSTAPESDFICRLDNDKAPCEGSSVTLSGLSQRTHNFQVTAEDDYGERDKTPATRDFAVPVDDAGLTKAGKWKRKKAKKAYLGTFSQTRKKGAALTYRVANVRELALLVRTGKRFGKVKVYLDDTLLGTVRTKGRSGTKVVKLGSFSTPRGGIVRIVTTSKKQVRIDGLGVSTTAF